LLGCDCVAVYRFQFVAHELKQPFYYVYADSGFTFFDTA